MSGPDDVEPNGGDEPPYAGREQQGPDGTDRPDEGRGHRGTDEPHEGREAGAGGAPRGGREPGGPAGSDTPPGGQDQGPAPREPRIPTPRASVEDTGHPLPDLPPGQLPPPAAPERDGPPVRANIHVRPLPPPLVLEHRVLQALLGAWALSACSPGEAAAVEDHLGGCGPCAEEALRLRDAVGLLHPAESLDLDPGLRTRVLESCLGRRPPRIPVPDWAGPYDAETARLDALLQDIGDAEWHAPVRLRWYEGGAQVSRKTTVAGVIAHLMTVDGLVAVALGLDDPLPGGRRSAPDDGAPGTPGACAGRPSGADGGGAAKRKSPPAAPDAPRLLGPRERTEAYWRGAHFPPTRAIRTPWREQSHHLVRTVSFAAGGPAHTSASERDGTAGRGGGSGSGTGSGRLTVPYGGFALPLRDALLDRAFECWVHADDIARAVDYPYEPPAPRHLHRMIDLAARMLPGVLAARRRAGLAGAPRALVAAGAPGRSLRLEIEGAGGGEWLIALDSPGALASPEHEVAHVALDGVEFCRLAAGHVPPEEAAAGQTGDREAIRDVLTAAASLSRI
ncbi:zf-HC2 domain-containing protein [Streptomyces sp. NPDC002004]